MRGLALYGAKCGREIWDGLASGLENIEIEYAVYSQEALRSAKSLSDLTAWTYARYFPAAYDFILGHSMGGQLALAMSEAYGVRAGKLILLESNPVPSGPFFRNLMTEENGRKYGDFTRRMFEREGADYCPELLASLRDDFDWSDAVRRFPGRVYAVYGDRGHPDDPRKYDALHLPADILAKMPVYFVPNACHLPMLENPEGLLPILQTILSEA